MTLEHFPLWLNIALFLAGAASVWFAGWRLARYVDALSDFLKIGKAFAGLLLLGGLTSLPEIAASSTAALSGNAPLAVNNLLGGVAVQVTILALADIAIGRGALTSLITDPVVMLQATFSILMLVVIAAAIIVGDTLVWGLGIWSVGLFAAFVLVLWLSARYQGHHAWVPSADRRAAPRAPGDEPSKYGSLTAVVMKTSAAGAVILVAGYFVTKSGEALATQTGLGSSFFGLVFLAIATSLPEVSTVVAAARLGRYGMALGDVFGANLFDKALIFLVDVLYAGPPVLNEVNGRFSAMATLLGIAVTTIYTAGMIEGRDRAVWGMGYDSAAVLITYLSGLVLLYFLR